MHDLIVNGKIIREGTVLNCIRNGVGKSTPFVAGTRAEVVYVNRMEGGNYSVAVFSLDGGLPYWHNLDGDLDYEDRGYYLSVEHINEFFEIVDGESVSKIVAKEVIHKGTDLRGKKCRLLESGPVGVLVEFEENIRGFSGDGKGKMGHCLLLSPTTLTDNIEKKQEKKEEIPSSAGEAKEEKKDDLDLNELLNF